MNIFNRQKVAVRLGLGFGIVLILLSLIVLTSYLSISKLNDITEELTHNRYRKVVILHEIKDSIHFAARVMRNIAISKDPQIRIKEEARIQKAAETVKKNFNELEQSVKQEGGKKLLADLKAARNSYIEECKKIFSMLDAGKWDEATRFMITDFRPAQNAYLDAADKFLERMDQAFIAGAKNASSTSKTSKLLIIAFGIIAVLLSSAIAWLVSRSIVHQLGGEPTEIAEIANRIAAGNLTITKRSDDKKEFGVLADMNHMARELREIVARTIDISNNIASSSDQLHSTAEQIATGTEQVVSQASSVATASEEMASTSTDIANNCLIVSETSMRTNESANSGVAVVQETIVGMDTIAERVKQTSITIAALGTRSEEIGSIIETIEDIADQTNLLALNAAIEAARAGEQGRGFAVVADEVRALAERTSKATHEIGNMIKGMQDETKIALKAMDEGVEEVRKGATSSLKSGQALEEILQRINEVSMQVSQIATAAEEQTATTSEVSMNMQQISEVVQQTARGAEETANAASVLAEQANELQDLISRFKLK